MQIPALVGVSGFICICAVGKNQCGALYIINTKFCISSAVKPLYLIKPIGMHTYGVMICAALVRQ